LAFFAAELESQSIDLDAPLVAEVVPMSLLVEIDVADRASDAPKGFSILVCGIVVVGVAALIWFRVF